MKTKTKPTKPEQNYIDAFKAVKESSKGKNYSERPAMLRGNTKRMELAKEELVKLGYSEMAIYDLISGLIWNKFADDETDQ